MFKYLYWFSTLNTNRKCIFRIFCDTFYEFFFVGALAILLCSFNTAFSSRSKQSTPLSSKKSAHERLKESSRVKPVFPSLNCRTSSYMSSNLNKRNGIYMKTFCISNKGYVSRLESNCHLTFSC